MMKPYTIRLYRVHDYDLLSLMLLHNFDLRKAMYISLKNFCAGKNIVFETPPEQYPLPPKMCSEVRIYVRIDASEDPEIIELLSKVRDGSRNAFIKGLLRLCICNPAPNEFMETESDADDMALMLDKTFRNDRKTIHFENMMLSKVYRNTILQQIENNASAENKERKRKRKYKHQDLTSRQYTDNSSILEHSSIFDDKLSREVKNNLDAKIEENLNIRESMSNESGYQDGQSVSSDQDFVNFFDELTEKDD